MPRWTRRQRRAVVGIEPIPDEVAGRVASDRAERERRLVGQETLVSSIEELLFAADPIGINFEHNVDEYRPEAQTIALRLPEATTVEELRRIVYEEFLRWFGDAGPEDLYSPIADAIWGVVHPNEGR